MSWIVLNENGCITQAGNTEPVPIEAVPAPPQFQIEMAGQIWWDGEEWLPRITLFDPVDNGTDLVWSDVPEGTVFIVVDVEGNYVICETADTTLTIAEPGEYLIQVEPPQPFLSSHVKVTR